MTGTPTEPAASIWPRGSRFAVEVLVVTAVLVVGFALLIYVIGPHVPNTAIPKVNLIAWLVIVAYLAWVWIAFWRSVVHAHTAVKRTIRTGLIIVPVLVFVVFPLHDPYTARAKVSEGTSVSSPHRTAIWRACSEKDLRPGMSHEDFGFVDPDQYNSKYVSSVTAETPAANRGRVTIVYRDIGEHKEGWPLVVKFKVPAGATVVYEGACDPGTGSVTWTVGGTVAPRLRPKG